MLDALVAKLATGVVYTHREDERLAEVVVSLLRRADLDVATLRNRSSSTAVSEFLICGAVACRLADHLRRRPAAPGCRFGTWTAAA